MNKFVWKKCFVAALLLQTAVLLSGCTTEHEQSDIESYLKEELGLTEYSISDSYEEAVDEEGYTDQIWTVVDEKNDITFHVLDDYHWGAESLVNYLYDDYSPSVFVKYQDQLPESDLVKAGRITITAGPDSEGINQLDMEAVYADRAELQSILDELVEYREFFEDLGFDAVDCGVGLQYEGPADYPSKGNMVGGNSWAYLRADMDYVYNEAMEGYIQVGLDCRLPEVFADTTEAERQEVILGDQTNRVGIVRENDETDYYDDLIGNEYGYGMSVATLYQVLEREGLGPEGDESHFTCVGVDGIRYEFSCDFVAGDFDGEERSYYLADGVPVQLWNAYNVHIRAGEASKLFGINIAITWNEKIGKE